jgi:hypothetical protein
MQNGKFNVADLIAIYDTGIVPSCFGNVAASPAESATDPAVITVLAATAYVWGLGPEFGLFRRPRPQPTRPYRRPAIASRRRHAEIRNGSAGYSARIGTTHCQPIAQERRRIADPVVRPNAACRCACLELDPNTVHGLLQHDLQYPGEDEVPVDASHVLPDARKRAAVDPTVHCSGVWFGDVRELHTALAGVGPVST